MIYLGFEYSVEVTQFLGPSRLAHSPQSHSQIQLGQYVSAKWCRIGSISLHNINFYLRETLESVFSTWFRHGNQDYRLFPDLGAGYCVTACEIVACCTTYFTEIYY